MGAVAALRTRIEAAIAADTGAGGLKEGPNGAANVQAVYYEKQAASDARSNIIYSIEEVSQPATNYDISLLSVTFTVFVPQDQVQTTVGSTGNYGYTKLEAIRDRLLTILNGVTMAAQDSWTFSPMHYERRGSGPVGREQTRTVERYSVVANKARSVPSGVAGIVTGVGINISGALFSASILSGGPKTVGGGATGTGDTFDIQAPYAFALQQSGALEDITFETDRFERATFGVSRCRVVVQFFPVISGSTIPRLPIGELKSLTLTLANSLTYTITSGSAIVYDMDSNHTVEGDVSRGRYLIHVNGTMTPNYGAL